VADVIDVAQFGALRHFLGRWSVRRNRPSEPSHRHWQERISVDNRGGFMIRDPMRNVIVAGEKFDYRADDVIEFCAKYRAR
jgi:hypothetical protein